MLSKQPNGTYVVKEETIYSFYQFNTLRYTCILWMVFSGKCKLSVFLLGRSGIICVHTQTHSYTHTCMYVCTHTRTYIHTHTRINACTHTYTHVYTHMYICIMNNWYKPAYMITGNGKFSWMKHTCLYALLLTKSKELISKAIMNDQLCSGTSESI